jgi:hypothetical protein
MANTKTLPEKLYGRTDFDSISVTFPDGSVHRHDRTRAMGPLNEGQFILVCKECIAQLLATDPNITAHDLVGGNPFTTHWAVSPSLVPKSSAEQLVQEEAERQMATGRLEEFQEFQEFRRQRRGRAINLAR